LSSDDIEKSIDGLLNEMKVVEAQPYADLLNYIAPSVVFSVSDLLKKYGVFIGNAKAKHPSYFDKLRGLDDEARSYFQSLIGKEDKKDQYYSIVILGIQKISEILSFVREIEFSAATGSVSEEVHGKVVREKEDLERVLKILAESKGYPLLSDLLEKAKTCGIDVNENWATTIGAVNLVEAATNKKLEILGESLEGSFSQRLERLRKIIKRQENRDIQQLLPGAFYKVRSMLDHASHKYKPTSEETDLFVKGVISFLNDLFPLSE
jgi:hypothetical protein